MSIFVLAADYMAGWAMTHPGPVLATAGVLGASGVLGIAAVILRRDDMPLGRDDQATVDLFATMPREVPPEVHHERHVPRHAKREPAPLAPTAVLARPPRPEMRPVLLPPAAPALAVLGVLSAHLMEVRDARRWPELVHGQGYEDSTGSFAAICREGT